MRVAAIARSPRPTWRVAVAVAARPRAVRTPRYRPCPETVRGTASTSAANPGRTRRRATLRSPLTRAPGARRVSQLRVTTGGVECDASPLAHLAVRTRPIDRILHDTSGPRAPRMIAPRLADSLPMVDSGEVLTVVVEIAKDQREQVRVRSMRRARSSWTECCSRPCGSPRTTGSSTGRSARTAIPWTRWCLWASRRSRGATSTPDPSACSG